MIDLLALADRRDVPRLTLRDADLTLRLPGQLGRQPATLIDFNRHGLAVCLAGPISPFMPRTTRVHVSLRLHGLIVEDVVAAVHNAVPIRDGLRLGLRFRTEDPEQLDAPLIAATLGAMEARVVRANRA